MSTGRSEDEAWRAIVDNYGDRPELDDPAPEPPPERAPAPAPEDSHGGADAWGADPTDRFVPPVPAPAPRLPAPKRAAWLGVLGSPAALVLAMLAGLDLPRLVGYGLVVAFVGGFAYLVTTMERAEGRDPFDDGAQI